VHQLVNKRLWWHQDARYNCGKGEEVYITWSVTKNRENGEMIHWKMEWCDSIAILIKEQLKYYWMICCTANIHCHKQETEKDKEKRDLQISRQCTLNSLWKMWSQRTGQCGNWRWQPQWSEVKWIVLLLCTAQQATCKPEATQLVTVPLRIFWVLLSRTLLSPTMPDL